MVLMRACESFEDLEKRYNRRLANTGIRSGMAAIMSYQVLGACKPIVHMGRLTRGYARG